MAAIETIDLAASRPAPSLRLADPAAYPTWYSFAHPAPALLAEARYGLPELTRAGLRGRSGPAQGADDLADQSDHPCDRPRDGAHLDGFARIDGLTKNPLPKPILLVFSLTVEMRTTAFPYCST